MALYTPRGFGWRPSIPDFRDYATGAEPVESLLQQMRAGGHGAPPRAARADLREYFVPVSDQGDLDASTAHACAALVEYFERRAKGHLLAPSRLFVHQNALKLAGGAGCGGLDLRTVLKSLILCGAPPERLWPYCPQKLTTEPEPFLYMFTEPYRGMTYVRLDERKAPPERTLQHVKAFLAAGFPCAFGFSVPNSLTDDGDIAFRPTFDSPLGGQAMLAVGYNDRYLRGSRGALLVRSSWGVSWGEEGYGWLPYAFIEEQLAMDFWTLLHPAWLLSGEFDVPELRG